MSDSIGDRMKRYEDVLRLHVLPRTPLIVRVDGRAFHTWASDFERPFDEGLRKAMLFASEAVARDMQGFKVGYHQSDEVSFLLTDYDTITSQSWFGGNLQKITSIAASVFTAAFNNYWAGSRPLAYFDARAFNVPIADVSNYFLWRAKDWERNSVSMYCGAFFTHHQMHGKGRAEQHEMLHRIGKNWTTDVTPAFRNGSFFSIRDEELKQEHVPPTFDLIDSFIASVFA